MKRIIQKAKELIADIEKEVESRDKLYAARAKSWSKAEKVKYLEQIDRLSEMLNQLNDRICELTENF